MAAGRTRITVEPLLRDEDRPLEWGRAREMNALEALMWRAEEDPRLRSTICGLEELDRTPDWERFLAAHEWATRLVPRFRQHVVEPLGGIGAPAWVTDPDFDLHYHVRRVRLPAGGGWSDLLAAAEQIAMTPFDRHRALWEAVLFEGLPEGRAAYLIKLHHSTTDGLGVVDLLSNLHSRTRESNPDKPQPLPPLPEHRTRPQELAYQLARDTRALPGDLARGAASALRLLGRPRTTVRDASRIGGSVRRVLGGDTEGSPLLRARGMSWRFSAFDVEFAELRAAAKAVGGSINDAFLAALLGAFRRYHEELGAPIQRMPIAVPISVRSSDSARGGNQIVAAWLAAPVDVEDPAERIRSVGAMMRAARGEPALEVVGMIAPALSRLPGPLISQLAGGLTKANDLQASNVRGIREDVYIAGAKIERAYPFGPLPGCATMITLASHGSVCCVGANVDPAAVTEPERFDRNLGEGFDEVLALAGDFTATRQRL
jgi:WS/DGAT/MGAT family acyltransferase